jgi:stalled ribosome rescue protein Dom34
MPMVFFYFLKIIFDISTSKRSKTYKPYSILVKKKFKIFGNAASATAAFPNIVLMGPKTTKKNCKNHDLA